MVFVYIALSLYLFPTVFSTVMSIIGKKKVKKEIINYIESKHYIVDMHFINNVFRLNEETAKDMSAFNKINFYPVLNYYTLYFAVKCYIFKDHSSDPLYYRYLYDIKEHWNYYCEKLEEWNIIEKDPRYVYLKEAEEKLDNLKKKYDSMDIDVSPTKLDENTTENTYPVKMSYEEAREFDRKVINELAEKRENPLIQGKTVEELKALKYEIEIALEKRKTKKMGQKSIKY